MGTSNKRKFVITIALLLTFGALVVFGSIQSQQYAKKYRVDEYFNVSVAYETWAGDKILNNGTNMIVHAILVTVKAVKGDAHGVIIQSWANSENLVLGDIPKGELRSDYMISPKGALVTKGPDGRYSVTLTLLSEEATGKVSVGFK